MIDLLDTDDEEIQEEHDCIEEDTIDFDSEPSFYSAGDSINWNGYCTVCDKSFNYSYYTSRHPEEL